MYTSIGTEKETGGAIRIGGMERRSGLYILGRSGVGKSWLMVNLILQDIENGHGVLFLDPHGKGIDELIDRLISNSHALQNVVLFDPEHKTRSFGINLLSCRDIHDLNERQETYTRAKGVFDKIWKNAYYELPWLQMILQYVIYTFIENPDYTLSEVLRDKNFRNHVAGNIKYHWQAAEFWKTGFQPKQVEAALTRVDTLLGHPYVNHIVSQRETTIDFNRIIEDKRIVLFRLSDKLSTELKTFIGTILISELVYSVKKRSTHNPRQFCVFVDEFQNFASYDDFSSLITGGRKYGIATTIAHQERFGQFADNKVILGATDGAGNKVIFQTSVRDGQELAPEFAREPPSETRPEPQLVISQEPVSDLLRGHDNAQIREFVNRYLRPIHEQLEDARGDMEGERLIRTDYLDEAALHRVDERVDWLRQRGRAGEQILGRVESAIERARSQTSKMYNLFETSKNIRQSLRDINKLFTALMEGRASCWGEDFCRFLIDRVRGSALVPDDYLKILELYIAFVYGNADTPRIIPVSLAMKCGSWKEEEVRKLIEDKHFSNRVGVYIESASQREEREDKKFREEREAVLREMKT